MSEAGAPNVHSGCIAKFRSAATSRELARTPESLARAYFTVRNSEYVIVPSTSSMADAAAA